MRGGVGVGGGRAEYVGGGGCEVVRAQKRKGGRKLVVDGGRQNSVRGDCGVLREELRL